VFKALLPFAVVYFAIDPRIDAFSISFAHPEVTEIRVTVGITLEAFTVPKISLPVTFILTAVRILHDAFSHAFSINHYA
jgi:hypothetical protein